MNQDGLGAGVIEGVSDLFWRQPNVYGLQNGAHHRHRKEALEISMAVPVHDRDGLAGLNAELGSARLPVCQCAREGAVCVPRRER